MSKQGCAGGFSPEGPSCLPHLWELQLPGCGLIPPVSLPQVLVSLCVCVSPFRLQAGLPSSSDPPPAQVNLARDPYPRYICKYSYSRNRSLSRGDWAEALSGHVLRGHFKGTRQPRAGRPRAESCREAKSAVAKDSGPGAGEVLGAQGRVSRQREGRSSP